MLDRRQYDVAVVGASLAGCSAAMFLARSDARVALIEGDPDPSAYKKGCTHFIQPSAVPTLERLGLAGPIEAAGGLRSEAEMFTRWGWVMPPPMQHAKRPAYGYSIRRQTLDPLLRKMAASTQGVDFMPGFSAQELLVSNSRISGVLIDGEDDLRREIQAKLVVGADGRNSRVAELAGLAAQAKPNGRFGYFAHYRNLPLKSGSRCQIWFLEPDIAYVFPNDDGVTLVAAMPERAKLADWKADPEAAMLRLFESLPNAPRLGDAQRVSPYMGTIEYPNLIRKVFRPGLALVGDAALCIDPLRGVGCGWAFQTAEWLADSIGQSWQSVDELERRLAVYSQRHKHELAGHEALISDFSTGRGYNPIERLMFSAAARDPVCAGHFFAFGGRWIGVAAFLSPAPVARSLWVNARHAMGANGAVRQQLQ
jgi:menaquinone-9 beta-reductase